MIKITSLPTIAGALLACGLSAVPAHAANRTWVSGMGTDSGACTRAAPCKTFAFALAQTAAGGEIDVLDPAGYGMVTITKAISIVNDGVGAATIGTSSGNGVTINAGAGDSVHLRGLTIAGLGSGANGIQFNTGLNLAIENCVVRGFLTGISIQPHTTSSFSVSNTVASNNSDTGIVVLPTNNVAVTGVLSRVITNNNGDDGILVNGSAIIVPLFAGELKVTIVDSEASNNFNAGVQVASSTDIFTFAMLRDVVASNNGTGLDTEGDAIIRVAHSVVTGNGIGVARFGGTIFSYGDNDIDGNTTDNTGVLTVIPTH